MTRAIRLLVWAEVALLGLLTASGLYLNWFYRPTALHAYAFAEASRLQTSVRIAHAVRALHLVASFGFIWIGAVFALVCIVGAVRSTREVSRRVAAFATGFAVVALAASFTGYLLPWSQLALFAVTVGANFHGAWDAAFSEQVRFVIVHSTEVSQTTYRNW